MTLPFLGSLSELGLAALAVYLFLSLLLVTEIGYRVGRVTHTGRAARPDETACVSTLTAGMLGLLAFTLSLSINFAQNRYETRRGMVLTEANAIGTAWLRTKLIEGDEGRVIAAKIEDFARARVAFTTADTEAEVPALIERTNVLQAEIWQSMDIIAHRSPNPVTTALVNALNEMFDDAMAQQFAYASSVPGGILIGLYVGSLLSIGALGYQFGLTGNRQIVLSSLLLLMWTGAMVLIADLNWPRMGHLRAEVAPLEWTIQGFEPKS